MLEQPPPQEIHTAGFNWREPALTLLNGWKIVAFCIVIALVLAVFVLRGLDAVYAAQMIVTTTETTNDSTSSKLSALGGLASLAGISTSTNQAAPQFRLYIDSLHSRDLAEDLAKNQNIMKGLFATEWDEAEHKWREPPHGLIRQTLRVIRAFLGYYSMPWEAPDGARLQGFLIDNIQIFENPKKSYLVTIEYDSTNPRFAVDFLNSLNKAADNHLRQKALLRTGKYINYLTNKLNTITVAEHREAILGSLSEQEKFEMTASSAAPFAADLFDAPSFNSTPISPHPGSIFFDALLIGGLIGAGIVFGIKYLGAYLPEAVRNNR